MLRLLSYAVFFLLGYRILKMLFGGNRQQVTSNQHKENISVKQPPPHQQSTMPDDGEYIEYEEVR